MALTLAVPVSAAAQRGRSRVHAPPTVTPPQAAPATPAAQQGSEPSGEDRQAAAEAYDRGRSAFLSRDYERAAEWFETADRLAPAELALEAAVRANERAGRSARSATLALQLQQRYPGEEAAQELAAQILRQAGPRLGRIVVECNEHCTVELDSVLQISTTFFVDPGSHRLVAHFHSGSVTRPAEATAGREQRVEVEAPPPRDGEGEHDASSLDRISLDEPASTGRRGRRHDEESSGGGPPPGYFWVGAVTTVALGGVLVWSGLDAQSGVSDYEAAVRRYEEGTGTRADAETQLSDGQSRELRTNILIGATAAAGAATVILAIVTDWGGHDEREEAPPRRRRSVEAAVTPLPGGGAGAAVTGRW